ncbi:serine hydrolase [Ekhidna sp.]|uniref:serine hydrolase domain-containing protein n=1 Tax=Ekhidna sp. TaxID=2608089 RepID=UPI003297B8F1
MPRLQIWLSFVILLFISCNQENEIEVIENKVIDLSFTWEATSPLAVGVDLGSIERAVNHASEIDLIRSLIIVKNGRLISENYFKDTDHSTLFDTRSITKSIVSTLTLIALDKGDLTTLDQKIDLGSSYTLNQQQKQISYAHLLSMTSGFAWDEWTNTSYIDWLGSADQIEFLLALELLNEPGTQFTYNSGAVHLLGRALANELGISLEDYAKITLFNPIGIDIVAWEQLSSGPNGGAGIDLRARDLAKVGQLFLQNGVSGEKRIISKESIEQLTTTKIALNWTFGQISSLSYGYLWWIVEAPVKAFMAWGYGGQFIVVIPEKNMVIVATTDWQSLAGGQDATELEQEVLDLIISELTIL